MIRNSGLKGLRAAWLTVMLAKELHKFRYECIAQVLGASYADMEESLVKLNTQDKPSCNQNFALIDNVHFEGV